MIGLPIPIGDDKGSMINVIGRDQLVVMLMMRDLQ